MQGSHLQLVPESVNATCPGTHPGDRPDGRADGGGAGRDVLVTRPDSLTGETFQPQSGVFVDWLTISQTHPAGGLPVVDAGVVVGYGPGGDLEWSTGRALKHEGSFETSVQVKCDGTHVRLSGNLSRFGRPDNLYGFTLERCIEISGPILDKYSLPRFTAGRKVEYSSRVEGETVKAWTGARISRIDITKNYECGSADNAHALLQYLGSQKASRQEGKVLGQGETVSFGGGRRSYWKAYIKHLELERHGGATPRVIQYCKDVGLVRFEGTIRSNKLTEMGCAWLGDYEGGKAMAKLIKLFEEKSAIMSRAVSQTDDLDTLPRHLRSTARDYCAGMDMTRALSRATFYRHRRDLLCYGIDIAVRNIKPFTPRVKVIKIRESVVPEWYQFAA